MAAKAERKPMTFDLPTSAAPVPVAIPKADAATSVAALNGASSVLGRNGSRQLRRRGPDGDGRDGADQ